MGCLAHLYCLLTKFLLILFFIFGKIEIKKERWYKMVSWAFWNQKRLEAMGRTFLTLFQAFLVAGLLGGFFNRITDVWLKLLFIFGTAFLFASGIVLSGTLIKEK
jgi:hypothetical protein